MTFKVQEQGKYLPTWKFSIPISEHLQRCHTDPPDRCPVCCWHALCSYSYRISSHVNLKDLSEAKPYLSHRSLTLTQTHHICLLPIQALYKREVIDMWQVKDTTLIKWNSTLSACFFSIIELWQSCPAFHHLACWYNLSVFISEGCVWAFILSC